MATVTGIGGFFFRSKDPQALMRWYDEHLGVTHAPSTYEEAPWRMTAGTCVFAPFPEDTGMFGDPAKQWMLNFRTDDLDALAAALTAKGVAVEVDPKVYENGRFATLTDPEGNPIQLWQPGGCDPG